MSSEVHPQNSRQRGRAPLHTPANLGEESIIEGHLLALGKGAEPLGIPHSAAMPGTHVLEIPFGLPIDTPHPQRGRSES